MKLLNDVNLLDLVPQSLLNDKNSKKILESIDWSVKKQYQDNITKFNVMSRIRSLSEKEIEELLLQFHVDYVDDKLTLAQKQELVINSIQNHMIKGTPKAVQNICNILFEYSEVKEWFEYGGRPYYFKVSTITGSITSMEDYQRILLAINSYKNVRSWLDGLHFIREQKSNLYVGQINKYKITYNLGCTDISIPNESNNLYTATTKRTRYFVQTK